MKDKFIVAIDGPAGSGKSTIAKRIAQHFNFLYIDTGAMYRALTLKAMEEGVDFQDTNKLQLLADKTKIDLEYLSKNSLKVFLDNRDVTLAIRSPEVTNSVFYIAKDAAIRKKMVDLQRSLARKHKKAVLEGRDIGTVVFPDADIKFFLDAHLGERAGRRFKELKERKSKTKVSFKQIEQDISQRDKKDKTRKVAPLKRAVDAIYIDTTNLSIKEVFQKVREKVENAL